jgi:NTE family protein
VRTSAFGLDGGREFGNWGEIRAGIQHERGSESVHIGDPNSPTLPSDSFDDRVYFFRMSYDRLDDVNFPRKGQQATVEWQRDHQSLGSNENHDRVSFSYLAAQSFGRYTTAFSIAGGTTIHGPPNQTVTSGLGSSPGSPVTPTDLRLLFTLGGLFNLSGLKANSLAGPEFGIARALVYKQIGRGGPGYFDVPTYLGLSLEMGNVWDRFNDRASFGNTRRDASVFLGLDTFLGPVYVASGFDDKGQQAFYLFLGRTF